MAKKFRRNKFPAIHKMPPPYSANACVVAVDSPSGGLKRAGAVREAHFLTPTNQFPLKLGRKSTTGGPLRL
jgi:hypothetical protein